MERLHEKNWKEVEKYLEKKDLILLPIGSTEQHGTHLPLMTDTANALMLAEELSKEREIMIAPPVWYGWSPLHLAFPGSITTRPETLSNLVEDICLSLIYHGFDRIIIISGHRGMNLIPLEPVIFKIRQKTGAYTALIDPGLIARKETAEICESEPGGIGHACEVETSLMLYYRSELVDMKSAEKNISDGEDYIQKSISLDPRLGANCYSFYSTIEEKEKERERMNLSGVMGDALKATPEKGKGILKAQVKNSLKVIDEAGRKKVEVHTRPLPI